MPFGMKTKQNWKGSLEVPTSADCHLPTKLRPHLPTPPQILRLPHPFLHHHHQSSVSIPNVTQSKPSEACVATVASSSMKPFGISLNLNLSHHLPILHNTSFTQLEEPLFTSA